MATTHLHSGTLRALIRAHDARQVDVAAAAGITKSAMSRLVAGTRHGTDAQLRARLAAALGVPTDVLTCHCTDPATHTRERAEAA